MGHNQQSVAVSPSSLPVVLRNNIIWTKHARERARKRNIPETMVADVLLSPYRIYPAKSVGSYKFIARQEDRHLHVIATPNQQKQWIIVSVWVRGEEDSRFWLEERIGSLVEWVLRKLFPRK